jgi:predicted nucleic acid-binding protein
MILCDTNILIYYFNFDPPTIHAFDIIGRENVVLQRLLN